MNKTTTVLALTIISLTCISSCSYLKSLFPDKEKDYQFTTEIAPLTLPDDLQEKDTVNTPAPSQPTGNSAGAALNTEQTVASEASSTTPEPTTESSPTATTEVAPVQEVSVELLKDDGNSRLRISAPLQQSWRIVDKALSRKSIEVTKRDQDGALFAVQYDPQERTPEYESFWDEMKFIFSGFETDEKEMILLLTSHGDSSEVSVFDSDQQPVNDIHSLSLLNLLLNTIKTDLVTTTK